MHIDLPHATFERAEHDAVVAALRAKLLTLGAGGMSKQVLVFLCQRTPQLHPSPACCILHRTFTFAPLARCRMPALPPTFSCPRHPSDLTSSLRRACCIRLGCDGFGGGWHAGRRLVARAVLGSTQLRFGVRRCASSSSEMGGTGITFGSFSGVFACGVCEHSVLRLVLVFQVAGNSFVPNFGARASAALNASLAMFDVGVADCSVSSEAMLSQRRSRLQKVRIGTVLSYPLPYVRQCVLRLLSGSSG